MKQVRVMAAIAYDRAVAQDLDKNEIAKVVMPMRDGLHKAIHYYAHHSVAECVKAIKDLESERQANIDMIAYYRQKESDSLAHVMMIKSALEDRMKSQGVDFLQEHDFSATLVSQDGRLFVEVR